ncbi:hypothetical protein D3C81_1085000 [compost metagenome]
MAPHRPGAPEAGLHLVDDDQPAGLAHQFDRALQQSGRDARQALVGEDRAEDHAGEADAGGFQAIDGALHLGQVGLDQRLAGKAMQRPVGLGEGNAAHLAEGLALAVHHRRHLVHRGGVAVVAEVAADDPSTAPELASDAQGLLVGLGPRAGIEHLVQAGAEGAEQPLGVGDDGLAQVAAVHVERTVLPGDGLGHPGVAMTDHRDVVVAVEVALAIGRVQVDAFATDEVQRLLVEQGRVAHHLAAAIQQVEVLAHGVLLGQGGHWLAPSNCPDRYFSASSTVSTL